MAILGKMAMDNFYTKYGLTIFETNTVCRVVGVTRIEPKIGRKIVKDWIIK